MKNLNNLLLLTILNVFFNVQSFSLSPDNIKSDRLNGAVLSNPKSLQFAAPFVIEGAPSFYNRFVGNPTPDLSIDLAKVFVSDGGSENLTYEVVSIESSGLIIGNSLNNGVITINFAANELGSAKVIVKATDVNLLSGQYEFLVQVIPEPSAFLRINAGGNSYASWQADSYFSGGAVYSNTTPIANTRDDALFQTEHWGSSFIYNIPVPKQGYYRINLLFAEIYHGVANNNGLGARVFNVEAEGITVLSNYDIFLAAGGPAKAVVEEIDSVLVMDGFLALNFTGIVDNAKISAIELAAYTLETVPNSPPSVQNPNNRYVFEGASLSIPIIASDLNFGDILHYQASGLPASLSINPNTGEISGTIEVSENNYPVLVTVTDNQAASSQVSFNINVVDPVSYLLKINAGGEAVTYGNEYWESDQFYLDGLAVKSTTDITNTIKDGVYQTERYGTRLNYEIPMPAAGVYNVTLHFAEFYWAEPGKRVFDVDIESGKAILNDYDIFQKAGGANLAVSESFTVDVTDGALTLFFEASIDEAKISGIEISSCISPLINAVSASVSQICVGGSTTITVNGALGSATQWNLYTSSCGGTLVDSNTTGIFEVVPALTTTYYIQADRGCGLPLSCVAIEIKVDTKPDATITAVGPFCTGDASVNLIAATPGGTWSGTGITSASSGAFNPATAGAGNHLITYTLTVGSCTSVDTQTIQVNQGPDGTITSPGLFCENDAIVNLTAATLGGLWSGKGITNTSLGTFDPSVAGVGSHTITYTITVGICTSINTKTIEVIKASPDATITAAGPFCESGAPVSLTATTPGGTWSGTGITNSSTGIFDPMVAGPGNYVITYTLSAGGCSSVDTETIKVDPIPDATITPAGPFCTGTAPFTLTAATVGGTWSGSGITNASLGIFNPSIAGPGSHVISYTVTKGACISVDTETILVPDAKITAAGPFCVTGLPVNLTSFTPGGTWSGVGITNASLGTFNPSVAGAGSHVVTYSISGTCTTTDMETIIVDGSPNATITAAGPFCEDNSSVTLLAGTPGGTWSGRGITSASSGTFSPSLAGPGSHAITYTITQGACTSVDTETIQVNPQTNATIEITTPFCASDLPFQLTAATFGGTWSGNGITNTLLGTFDPSVAGPGSHVITYTNTFGTCTSIDTETVKVDAIPNITITEAGPFCVGAAPVNLAAATVGGTWSGNGITSASFGTFNPSVAGVGSHLIGYTITTGACTVLDTETILVDEITANTAVTLSGNTLTASATSAIYQWINCAGNTNISGATSKTFTPQQSGSYAVRITENGCTSISACIDVVIVGIEDDFGNSISVYPNPASSGISIELPVPSKDVVINITDILGKSSMRNSYDYAQSIEMDTHSLSPGIYFINIKTSEIKTTVKLLIK
jgi:Malectin domain/Putative Ig domain/Secretion system C-terminal sorting domain/Ig-like domain CHU_C associated